MGEALCRFGRNVEGVSLRFSGVGGDLRLFTLFKRYNHADKSEEYAVVGAAIGKFIGVVVINEEFQSIANILIVKFSVSISAPTDVCSIKVGYTRVRDIVL